MSEQALLLLHIMCAEIITTLSNNTTHTCANQGNNSGKIGAFDMKYPNIVLMISNTCALYINDNIHAVSV